jgi:hypothetical protein
LGSLLERDILSKEVHLGPLGSSVKPKQEEIPQDHLLPVFPPEKRGHCPGPSLIFGRLRVRHQKIHSLAYRLRKAAAFETIT